MRYIHEDEFLDPDHSTAQAARRRLAPLIGEIMLAWNEVERWMNRNLRDAKLGETPFREPPVRQLSSMVERNFNEWISRFMPGPARGLTPDELRQLLLDLKTVRDDLAHNVWNYALHPTFGSFVNRVRENTKFIEEEQRYLAKLHAGDKRNALAPTPQFHRYCYIEAGLIAALNDMVQIQRTMLSIWSDRMQEQFPQRPRIDPPQGL